MSREEHLRDICIRVICRQPMAAITDKTIARADKILHREDQRAKREAIKQGVLDALIREARLLDKTVPTSFFEPTLRKLSLKNASKITMALLERVCPKLQKLEFLDLTGCFMLVDGALPLFLDKCPVLKSIKLENCRKLTDVAIDHMVQLGRVLQGVNLGGNFNITNKGILKLITQHPNRNDFREISLSGLVYEDSTVEALAINCSRLRHLSLGFNEHMTTQTLTSITRRLRLRKLHVPWCQAAVNDEVLAMLAKECRELEDLNICGIKAVTAAAIEQMILRCNISPGEGEDGGGLGSSNSSNKHQPRAKLKRFKIRYVGTNKPALDAIEEKYGAQIEFPR